MPLIHKTHDADFDEGLNGVLSDLTEDRYGDVVGDPVHPMLGWDTKDFLRNPIALFNHKSDFPIGRWRDLHVKDGKLLGRLDMAPKGSSPRIDELSALLAAGVLKGISVGFVPSEYKPRDNGGRHYLRQTLVEASLVSVPANPSALLTAKALGISKQTIDMIFKQSETSSVAQRIRDLRRVIRKLKDRIARETNPKSRATWMKSLEHLEKAEREMCASLEPRKRDADRRRAHSQEVRARAEALIRENDRLIAEYEASPAAQAKRYTEETIAAYTRTQQQSIPQDPPPYVPQGQHVTWRGQKIDLRLTWRGKKI